MAKKSSGKHYESVGVHSQDKSIYKAMRNERSELEKIMNKLAAWRQGKNPWLMVDGRKVRANDYWGDHKARSFIKENTADVEV